MDKSPEVRISASAPETQAIVTQPALPSVPVAASTPAPLPDPTNAPVQAKTPQPAPKVVADGPKTNAAPATLAAAPAPAVVTEPAAPKLPPLALQGVVYSRSRPSAVISGKTVFVGDRVREFRVVAIGADSATLVSNGQTNLLSLPD